MKDNFSNQAQQYAIFRPSYPDGLYSFIYNNVNYFDTALDCATGNGQVANILSHQFKKVFATDISDKQLTNAIKRDNIFYSKQTAEDTSFTNNFFDLITVAQAIHWFDFDKFYAEAKRILKPDGIIVVVGYGLIKINEIIDPIINNFYQDKIGSYWDAERKLIDEEYQTIPFPFSEIETPKILSIDVEWTLDQLLGYLNTWSAVQHYINQNGKSPLSNNIIMALHQRWPVSGTLRASFPLFIKAGKV